MPIRTIKETFSRAIELHVAGQLNEAERLYEKILAVESNHAGALHFLGVAAHQKGRSDLAIRLIRQAITIEPANPAAHSNLGEAYRAVGDASEAISCYRSALQLKPDDVAARNNLGIVLASQRRFSEAISEYRHALALKPDFPEAYNNMGNALKEQGQLAAATTAYQLALRLSPEFQDAHNNLGVVLADQGQLDEAIVEYRQALRLKPDHAEAWNNLGNALCEQGHFEEAIAAFRQALEFKSNFREVYLHLSDALSITGHPDGSIAAARRAIELKPDCPKAYNNLGTALFESGQFEDAMVACHRALEFQPGFSAAKLNQSLILLLSGDFERGWPLYEARWDAHQSFKRSFPQPMWDGKGAEGVRILIHAEQGFGDSIQFVRYAALIAALGGDVIVECPGPLVELFRSVKGVTNVIGVGDPLPEFDFHLPMLSQPLIFKTVIDSIPRDVPYLSVDPARSETWRKLLGGSNARLKIGLAWAGNPKNFRHRKRNIPFAKLQPLLNVEKVDFYNLQFNSGAERDSPLLNTLSTTDWTERIQDFADTAALTAELDLVISADTAVAHLAGALGCPVWTLLPFVPDWRWGLKSETTPWYPTMRLFRQPALGDWDSAIQRVAEELQKLAEAHAAKTQDRSGE